MKITARIIWFLAAFCVGLVTGGFLLKAHYDQKFEAQPPELVGTWVYQGIFPYDNPGNAQVNNGPVEARLELAAGTQAKYGIKRNGQYEDYVEGKWQKSSNLLYIERSNGGHAVMRILSISPTQLVLVTRWGAIITFMKLG